MPSRSLFLYWPTSDELERDDVEEAVEASIGDDGEVTGAGGGLGTVNLDVEIYDRDRSEQVLSRLDEAVSSLGLPDGGLLAVGALRRQNRRRKPGVGRFAAAWRLHSGCAAKRAASDGGPRVTVGRA